MQIRASLVAQTIKKLPAMQETGVQSLCQEDPLEKGMATHSSVLAWVLQSIANPTAKILVYNHSPHIPRVTGDQESGDQPQGGAGLRHPHWDEHTLHLYNSQSADMRPPMSSVFL